MGEKGKSFYQDRRALVTGGASFIGSHLTEALVGAGATVTVVDDFSSGKREHLSAVADRIDLVEGDLRDPRVAESVVRDQEVVFHLANVHGGRGFIETHPGEIVQNFVIDGNVFSAANAARVERVCFASSACVYPTSLQKADSASAQRYLSEEMADPFEEGCALADGEYGWCKLMGEMALRAYHKQFGLKGVSCRLFTVYGPRENESHAIIAFIAKALMRMDPFEIWGSGRQHRNFTYVDDVVTGMMLAAEKIEDGRAVNLGTDEIVRVIDAAKTVCEIVGHEPSRFSCDEGKPEGVYARAAAVSNQEAWLGFRPRTKFTDGLSRTIEWYRSQADLDRVRADLRGHLFERER